MPRRPRQFVPPPQREPDYSDPSQIRALAKLHATRRALEERYQADCWAFLTEACSTLDQIDGQTKLIPAKPYLECCVREWLAYTQVAVPKSRRMMVTWLFCACYYWLARYTPGAKIGFFARKQGEKETEGSNELVWRAHFIHRHLPPLLRPRPDYDYSTGRLVFNETQSEILALAQGADQARQYTFTGVLCDEMGFWEQAMETYVALRPTTQGGGRLTCVSSANPGFFESIVYDRLPGLRAA
jgi:hypothetical protein